MANVCNRCYINSKHCKRLQSLLYKVKTWQTFVVAVISSQNIVNVCNRSYIKSKQCKRLQSLIYKFLNLQTSVIVVI